MNADSDGKVNAIPEEGEQSSERSNAGSSIVTEPVHLRQAKPPERSGGNNTGGGERGAGKGGAEPLVPATVMEYPRRALARRLRSAFLAHRVASHLDPVRVVNKPVENAVRRRRFANLLVPARNRQLRGQDRGAHLVTIFADLQEVAS